MNATTKRLVQLVLSQKLVHASHTALRWMTENISIGKDAADNWKPSKKKSTVPIDEIVTLLMGIARADVRSEVSRV